MRHNDTSNILYHVRFNGLAQSFSEFRQTTASNIRKKRMNVSTNQTDTWPRHADFFTYREVWRLARKVQVCL